MDNQEFDDELITQFCDIADTTPDVAKNYLSVADGLLENALQLFFSNFEIPKKAYDPIPVDDSVEAGSSTNNQLPPPIDDVRAPIAAKTDVLVDDYNYGNWQQQTYQTSFQSLDPFRDFSEETEEFALSSEDEETWNKSKKLSELFKAPYDIIFNGSFQEARDKAKKESKWLLVNIQEPSEFACQVLNRDLWKDKDVKDLIKKDFVFIQYPITSREGQQYKQFYPFNKYPHISLVDPRTGERIRIWDDVIKPDVFVSQLLEFLLANNLKSSQPLKTDESQTPTKNIDTMTEEEQIRAAIEISMRDQNKYKDDESILIDDTDDYYDDFMDENDFGSDKNSQIDESDDIETNSDNKGKKKEEEDNDSNTFIIDPSLSKDELCEKFHGKIKAVVNSEPNSGNITDIQFRLPDGKRMVRSFLIDDKVLALFEYIKGSIPEAKEHPFDLLNFRESLIDKINETLHEANLEDSADRKSVV